MNHAARLPNFVADPAEFAEALLEVLGK